MPTISSHLFCKVIGLRGSEATSISAGAAASAGGGAIQVTGTRSFSMAAGYVYHGTAAQVSVQRTTGETRPVLNLTLGAASGSAHGLTVYAESGATAGFDAQQDAATLPNVSGPNLTALTSDGQSLSILGLAAFTGCLALRVQVPAAGTYSLTAAELLNLPAGTQPVLEDTKTPPRAACSVYSFTGAAGEPTDSRFWLSLNGAASPLATTSSLQTEVARYSNPTREGQATLLVPTSTSAGQVRALAALGRLVREQALTVGGALR